MSNADLRACEALVVGAGPGGAVAAILLARRGVSTALIDRAVFPRAKLCGGCLTRCGFERLADAGIADGLPSLANAPRLDELELIADRTRARIAVPTYRVVDRAAFDRDLLAFARREGVICTTGIAARLRGPSRVALRDQRGREDEVAPRVVIVADGLKGTTLRDDPRFAWRVRPTQRVGLGAIVRHLPGAAAPDAVTMFHAAAGYLGVAPLGDARAVVAAAFDPRWIKQHARGGALPALLRHVGLDPDELGLPERVLGAPALTRTRRRVEADGCVFLIGDATGYVEPYTGEGMSWAIEHAWSVLPVVLDALAARPCQSVWTRRMNQLRAEQTRLCGLTRNLLRRPRLARGVIRTCGRSRLAACALSAAVVRLQRSPERRPA